MKYNKETKSDNSGSKILTYINGITEEMADDGTGDSAIFQT